MADNRTMAELLQAPIEGYEDAIFIDQAYAFSFLARGAAWIWLEKEPPRSIQTWNDLVSKFINQFFPPSKTTNLRNEITRFQQRFDESFYEAWERFNDLLRACPHHGFSELHQLDTFYNALNVNDQDSLNSTAGGNFLDKMPRESLKIIESKSKVRQSRAKSVVAKVGTSSSTPVISSDVAKLKDMVKALLLDKKNQSPAPPPSTTPASVKAVDSNCETCRGAHSYQNCLATQENAYRDNIQEYVSQAAAANYNQGNTGFRPLMVANQIRPPGFPPHQNNQKNFNRGNNFNQNRGGNFNQPNFNQSSFNQGQLNRPQDNDAILRNMKSQGQSMQNQCQNIQNQYQNLQNQMATLTEMMSKLVSANTVSSSGSGTLPDRSVSKPIGIAKDVSFKVGVFHFPADFVVVDFEPDPRVPLILGRCFIKTSRALIDIHKGELTLHIRNEAITYNLDQTVRYSTNYNQKTANKIDVIESACEEYSQEVPGFSNVTDSGTPTPQNDPIVSATFPTLTPFGDRPAYHLEYAFLEGDNKLPVIIDKELRSEEKAALIKSSDQEKLKKMVTGGEHSSKEREGDDEHESDIWDLKKLEV
nr:reverse transcriptase domain-containing protein [Tanacetum cinerariifolium]